MKHCPDCGDKYHVEEVIEDGEATGWFLCTICNMYFQLSTLPPQPRKVYS